MSHASLALALVLGSLPVCFLLGAPSSPPPPAPVVQGEPNIGDCRPDIGPGGLIKIGPQPLMGNVQDVVILKTPLPSGAKIYLANGTAGAELLDWTKYTLSVDFGQTPPAAVLRDPAGAIVLQGLPSIRVHSRLDAGANAQRVLLTQNSADMNVLDRAGLLQVFGRVPGTTDGSTYVTTASVVHVAAGQTFP